MIINVEIVNATSGALKSNSVKTCPNGKLYGYHGNDKHWHEAEYTPRDKGSNYTAIGDPIYGDPCPKEETGNKNTETNNTEEDVPEAIESTVSTEKEETNQTDNNSNDDNQANDNDNNNVENQDTNSTNDIVNDDVKESMNTDDENDLISTIIGLGAIGGITAIVVNRKKKK